MKGACNGDNLFPIALADSTFDDEEGNHHDPVQCDVNNIGDPDVCPIYTMWDTNQDAPGSFGWIYWTPNGFSTPPDNPDIEQGPTDNTLEANMEWTERSGMWYVGDWVPSSTGNQGSQGIREQMEVRIKLLDEENRPPTVVIPLYGAKRGGGNNTEYQIAHFGAFHLVCYYHSQNFMYEREEGDCAPCYEENPSQKCVRGYFEEYKVPSMVGGCDDTGLVAPSFRRP
jgi:hypothetical protein